MQELIIPQTHISIADQYIKDYKNLIYKIYPSFQNTIYITYYSLSIEESNFDKNMISFYDSVNNKDYGGRFHKIYNFPVMSSTNTTYQMDSNEKGITTTNNSEITCKIDPTINIQPKIGDILQFQIDDEYFGLYKITNIDQSATFKETYKSLTCSLIAGLTESKLGKFIVSEKFFLQETHTIYDKEVAIIVADIQNRFESLINKLNSSYKKDIDFHILKDGISCITSFERSLNKLYKKYSSHILFSTFCNSCSFKINFHEEEPISIFDILLDPLMEFDKYYKRLKPMKYYNEFREICQFKEHKYYSIDRSFEDYKYHDYIVPSEYTCSATFLSDTMETKDFWSMFDLWLDIIKNGKDPETFINKKIYDQRVYKLLRGWIRILVTKEYFINQRNCTFKYFDEMCENCNIIEAAILLSQLMYMNSYFITDASYVEKHM